MHAVSLASTKKLLELLEASIESNSRFLSAISVFKMSLFFGIYFFTLSQLPKCIQWSTPNHEPFLL